MSSLSFNSNSDLTTLAVPKLHDDRSNWADYAPQIQKAMGLKELWRHIEGKVVTPTSYVLVNGVPVTSDGKTPATEEQIEAQETQISCSACYTLHHFNTPWCEDQRPKNSKGNVGCSQK